MPKKWSDEYLNRTGNEKSIPEIWGHYVCMCCDYPTISEVENSDGLEETLFDPCILCRWIESGQDDSNADEVNPENYPHSLTRARKEFAEERKTFKPFDLDDKKITKPEKISAKKYELIELFESFKDSRMPAVSNKAKEEISDKIKELEKLKGYA